MERLLVVRELLDELTASEGDVGFRRWLLSPSIYDEAKSIALVIRDGGFDEARASAKRLIEDAFTS